MAEQTCHHHNQTSNTDDQEGMGSEEREGEESNRNVSRRSVVTPSMPNTYQMRILYAGSLCTFESISPEKAQAIILMASAAAAAARSAAPSAQSYTAANPNMPLHHIQGELPLIRRNSLQRFLEKRRERLIKMAPYAHQKPQISSDRCSIVSDPTIEPES